MNARIADARLPTLSKSMAWSMLTCMSEFTTWVAAQTGGLRLTPVHRRAALLAALYAIVVLSAWSVLLDTVVFADALPVGHREFHTAPLWPRTFLFSIKAFSEELLWRLLVLTALVMIGVRLFGRAPAAWFVLAIALAQLACIWPAIPSDPAYVMLRYWPPGCVWGWLYWRHGWISAALGHGAVHLVLDPLLFWVI